MLWCDINRGVVNKDVKNWFDFNNSFVTQRLTVDELINEIQNGHSYTTVHRKEALRTKSARHSENFSFGQHFALDFDGDSGDFRPTIENVSRIPIVSRFASFIHTTPSHTGDSPRTRAVFILEDGIKEADIYTSAVSFANRVVGVTDTSCTDPVRVFFGSKDCEVLRLGNTVPVDVFKTWAEKEVSIQEPPRVVTDTVIVDASMYTKYVEAAIVAEVSELANAAQGGRHMHTLKSASRLGSIMKSAWCPGGMLATDSIAGMLMAACQDNGLISEDGQRAVYKTIMDGIANATPRPAPPTAEMKHIEAAHDSLPVHADILNLSEMDRAYSAYRAGKIAQQKWGDISERTINDLGIIFTEDNVVVPFVDHGSMDDIARKENGKYKYEIGVDTAMVPEQPFSESKIAVVTKNPEDIAALFDKIRNTDTPYEVFGTSEIGKVIAGRLAKNYDEVIFLTYDADANIELAKSVISNSGLVNLQGTLRDMFSWGLDQQTFENMLNQAW